MKYRPEIDGLRAVAVLPVIFFHAGFDLFSGGYVGVDVFFVISGYLITTIIIGDLQAGKFSISRFYERRVLRILPALFTVIFVCLPFAYFWMLPSQLKDFAQSIVAVVFFSSNILFWREDGYFEASADLKPLLHTWSLAVEEQYYLIFPVLLMVMWRFGRTRLFWSIVAIAIASLLLAEWGWRNRPVANFYLAPTRAWELVAGSICALFIFTGSPRKSNALSAVGLALIVFSIFVYDEATPSPSIYLLVPVLGAALIIIYASKDTLVAKFLSRPLFVGIGLVSYSAYLWHQPVFAFARIGSLAEPSRYFMATLAIAVFFLAWVTWKYVEQPFRRREFVMVRTRARVFLSSLAVGSVLVVAGLVTSASDGFPQRIGSSEEFLADLDRLELRRECFGFDHRDIGVAKDWFCEAGARETYSSSIAVIGDSHALSYFDPLDRWGAQNGVRFLFNGVTNCPPLIDTFVRRYDARGRDCAARNASIFSNEALDAVDAVVLIARWTYYGVGDATGQIMQIGLSSDVDDSIDLSLHVFFDQFENTLSRLSEREVAVVVVHQPPLQLVEAISVLQRSFIERGDLDRISDRVSIDLFEHSSRYGALKDQMNGIMEKYIDRPVVSVDFSTALCDPVCRISREDRAIYLDDDHLSNFGAQYVLPTITSEIRQVIGR